MEDSPFEREAKPRLVFATTFADAGRITRERHEAIAVQIKREKDEEMAAICRLLQL